MEERRRAWLCHWHDVINAESGADTSFDIERAYNDPDSDSRMHFMTWGLSDEALRRCFQVLPCGPQMAVRAIEMRTLYRGNTLAISEQEAVALFQSGLQAFAHFSDAPELKNSIRVNQISSADLNSATMYADRVAVLLEAIDWQLVPEHFGVRSFVHETLYRLAHSYDAVDYITWPLISDPQSVEPYRPFARLALTDTYFPLLDEDGPVLFVVAR